MGTDIHAFIEYSNEPTFSGLSGEPAYLFAGFQLIRDYRLFDALGDGRSSQLTADHASKPALYPPRGIPPDVSIMVARKYYRLIADSDIPHPSFWPRDHCISSKEADERIQQSKEVVATVQQTIFYGTTAPRSWSVIPRLHVFNPSWLFHHEIEEALQHADISSSEIGWDFRAVLTCLETVERDCGPMRVRLVFWFDK